MKARQKKAFHIVTHAHLSLSISISLVSVSVSLSMEIWKWRVACSNCVSIFFLVFYFLYFVRAFTAPINWAIKISPQRFLFSFNASKRLGQSSSGASVSQWWNYYTIQHNIKLHIQAGTINLWCIHCLFKCCFNCRDMAANSFRVWFRFRI